MNDEGLKNNSKVAIKSEKLREYLLTGLKIECELNSLNFSLPSFNEQASQRFEKK
ncbi:MAG: hypothetical protein WAL30_02775 [Candidatus Aquirickettsiella sp.]